jgi:hypothetical protein
LNGIAARAERMAALRFEHSRVHCAAFAVHCGQIWRYSDGNSSGSLDKPKFYVFMRLVSLTLQKLRVPSTHSSAHAAYPTRLACTSQSQQEQPLARSRPCRVDPSRFRRAVQAQHWPGGVPHHRSRLRSFLRRCRCKLGSSVACAGFHVHDALRVFPLSVTWAVATVGKPGVAS